MINTALIKLGLSLGGVIALGVAAIHVANLHDRADALQLLVDDQAACVASIKLAPLADRPSVKCDLVVSTAVIRGQQSIDCDNALSGEQAYRIAAACSQPVKTVQADRDTARIERDGLKGDLGRLRVDQAAALSRAVARAKSPANKETIAHAALDDAPVDGAGLTVCSADCLRGLSGQEPDAPGGGAAR